MKLQERLSERETESDIFDLTEDAVRNGSARVSLLVDEKMTSWCLPFRGEDVDNPLRFDHDVHLDGEDSVASGRDKSEKEKTRRSERNELTRACEAGSEPEREYRWRSAPETAPSR